MSMHCALAGIPGAITYKTDLVTYLLGRWLVKVEFIGIANLLLKESMYPEFIQGAATPTALAAELRASLEQPARLQRTQAQAVRLRQILQGSKSGAAAAWLAGQLASGALGRVRGVQ
jgi:lipid-A-disaccharide synthase